MLEEVGRGERVVAQNCAGEVSLGSWDGPWRSGLLRESSRWLVFPTLGFSMKNCVVWRQFLLSFGHRGADSPTWRGQTGQSRGIGVQGIVGRQLIRRGRIIIQHETGEIEQEK